MSRDEAVSLVLEKQYEFPGEYLDEFLEFHQITEIEFWDCAERYRNTDIWRKVGSRWHLRNELS
jgi:hypothetical protein